jgi:hypothetical protein
MMSEKTDTTPEGLRALLEKALVGVHEPLELRQYEPGYPTLFLTDGRSNFADDIDKDLGNLFVALLAALPGLLDTADRARALEEALRPFAARWDALRDPLPQRPSTLVVDAMACCEAARVLKTRAALSSTHEEG